MIFRYQVVSALSHARYAQAMDECKTLIVMPRASVQGMHVGLEYEVISAKTQRTAFGGFTCYLLEQVGGGAHLWVANGNLLLDVVGES